MRSRVIPGSSPTIDRRLPVSRLNSVDFPTFGRPTMAMTGASVETVRRASAGTRPSRIASLGAASGISCAGRRLLPAYGGGRVVATDGRAVERVTADLARGCLRLLSPERPADRGPGAAWPRRIAFRFA